jgi:hypothetical protein
MKDKKRIKEFTFSFDGYKFDTGGLYLQIESCRRRV